MSMQWESDLWDVNFKKKSTNKLTVHVWEALLVNMLAEPF